VLASLRIKVKGGRVSYVASSFVRYHRDIIAYLALVRIAFERIKRIAHCHVRRPGRAGVSAKRIEQLGVRVIGSVARIIPDSVESSVGGYRERAKPMPLVRINRVVVDLHWCAKG
jgi:hypothetical protein